jgi:hypothetical protein
MMGSAGYKKLAQRDLVPLSLRERARREGNGRGCTRPVRRIIGKVTNFNQLNKTAFILLFNTFNGDVK